MHVLHVGSRDPMGTGAPVAFTVTPLECNCLAITSYSNVLVNLLAMTVSMHASSETLPSYTLMQAYM